MLSNAFILFQLHAIYSLNVDFEYSDIASFLCSPVEYANGNCYTMQYCLNVQNPFEYIIVYLRTGRDLSWCQRDENKHIKWTR